MKLLDQLSLVLLLRALNRGLAKVEARMAEQNRLLARLVEKWAPDVQAIPVAPDVRSVDFSEDAFQGRVLDYIERTTRDLGREPTEEEVVDFLEGRRVGSAR